MTHIKGHVPNQTLEIIDTTKNGKITKAHGFLHPYKENESEFDENFRILFINNLNCEICSSTLKRNGAASSDVFADLVKEKRQIGFHLKLIETNDPSSKMAVAYDIISWSEHQAVELCIKEWYKVDKLEEMKEDQFIDAKKKAKENTAKLGEDKFIKILDTSSAYLSSRSYNSIYKGGHPYIYIKNNIKSFEPEFLGGYE